MDDKDQQARDATQFGDDPMTRPADNARVQDVSDPNLNPFSVLAPEGAPKEDPDDAPAADDDDEDKPKPASMSMTKAELLERVQELEEKLKKAELIERIQELEGEQDDAPAEHDAVPDRPLSHDTREATIDGNKLTWTEATEHQVPEVYREVWRNSRAMGG